MAKCSLQNKKNTCFLHILEMQMTSICLLSWGEELMNLSSNRRAVWRGWNSRDRRQQEQRSGGWVSLVPAGWQEINKSEMKMTERLQFHCSMFQQQSMHTVHTRKQEISVSVQTHFKHNLKLVGGTYFRCWATQFWQVFFFLFRSFPPFIIHYCHFFSSIRRCIDGMIRPSVVNPKPAF